MKKIHLQLLAFFVMTTCLLFSDMAIAKKKNKDNQFMGLFGSYRENYLLENPGKDTAYGLNLILASYIPTGSLASSREETTAPAATRDHTLHYSTSFNIEAEVFMTLKYHYMFYFKTGLQKYDTRKENEIIITANPDIERQFHLMKMTMIPLMAGVRYRFSKKDIVPYLGIGAGLTMFKRTFFYDHANDEIEQSKMVLTGEVQLGAEFFVSPSWGLKVELAGTYLNTPDGAAPGFVGSPTVSRASMISEGGLLTMKFSGALFFML